MTSIPETLIHRRVAAARAGDNPYVICKMRSGWLVIGDVQPVPGYCVLLPDPVVTDLNALSENDRRVFLEDMTRIGDALHKVTSTYRINYEVLGNAEPALHAHIFPRYLTEPDEVRWGPIFCKYNWKLLPAIDLEAARPFMTSMANLLKKCA